MLQKMNMTNLIQHLLILLFLFLLPINIFCQSQNTSNPIIDSDSIKFNYHNIYAKTVYLKSSFDKWRKKYPFTKTISERGIWDGWWELKLPISFREFQLKKGKYYYKIVVDGNFISDNLNPNYIQDDLDNRLSFFELDKDLINYNVLKNPIKVKDTSDYYRFIFKSHQAKQVNLVGNFNHWNPHSLRMTLIGDGTWEIIIKLPPGKYYYNFIVDGRWIKDPLNTKIINNVIGKAYSFFEVKKD